MGLQTQIMDNIKDAMRAKDTVALEALRAIKSELLLAQTATGSKEEISEDEEIKIIQKLVKMRKDSAKIFTEQNRSDLAEPELAQIAVIEKFLPKQLSENEIELIVSKIIAETGASGIASMGKVMAQASSQIGGAAEGKTISSIVKKLLVVLVLFLGLNSFSQESIVDLNAGGNFTAFDNNTNSNFKHFGLGYTYMFDARWGAGLDFGFDTFNNGDKQINSVQHNRVTLKVVSNLSDLLNNHGNYSNFSLYGHLGLGYGEIRVAGANSTVDHLANVAIGIRPALNITDEFGIFLDNTIVFNLSQHIDFKGDLVYNGNYPASVTKIYDNLSLGIFYKFGQR